MKYSKNHSISKLVARTILIISIGVLAYPLIPFFIIKQQELSNVQVSFPHKWALIFPVLLFLLYVGLMIKMLQKKFQSIEMNALFSLAGLMLTFYLLMLYSRIFVSF